MREHEVIIVNYIRLLSCRKQNSCAKISRSFPAKEVNGNFPLQYPMVEVKPIGMRISTMIQQITKCQ